MMYHPRAAIALAIGTSGFNEQIAARVMTVLAAGWWAAPGLVLLAGIPVAWQVPKQSPRPAGFSLVARCCFVCVGLDRWSCAGCTFGCEVKIEPCVLHSGVGRRSCKVAAIVAAILLSATASQEIRGLPKLLTSKPGLGTSQDLFSMAGFYFFRRVWCWDGVISSAVMSWLVYRRAASILRGSAARDNNSDAGTFRFTYSTV